MVRLIILIVSFTLSYLFIFGQEDANNNSDDSSYYEKASHLKEYYALSYSTNSDTSDYYINKFVTEFPSDFECFVNIYGYDSKTEKPGILYRRSKAHIELFSLAESKVRNKRAYFTKIINICKGGEWQADGVNYFNNLVHKKVIGNQDFIRILGNDYTEDEIYQFWMFYFDGPVPPKSIPDNLKFIADYDKGIYSLIKKALFEVQKKWEK